MTRNKTFYMVLLMALVAMPAFAAPVHACTQDMMAFRSFYKMTPGGGASAYAHADPSNRFGASNYAAYDPYYAYPPYSFYENGCCRWRAGGKTMNMQHHPQVERNDAEQTVQGQADTDAEAPRSKPDIRYAVQAGDTLYRIAMNYDTSVEMLMLKNNITDPKTLQIGTVLHIPGTEQEITNALADDRQIKETFFATLTAYTAGYESTGKTPSHPQYGITASGARVKENHTIAVDPNVIPLGSYVYIEGLGIRKAEDVGSAIKGSKIDVYIPDLEEALEFGVKKNVKVHVLDTRKDQQVQIASAD